MFIAFRELKSARGHALPQLSEPVEHDFDAPRRGLFLAPLDHQKPTVRRDIVIGDLFENYRVTKLGRRERKIGGKVEVTYSGELRSARQIDAQLRIMGETLVPIGNGQTARFDTLSLAEVKALHVETLIAARREFGRVAPSLYHAALRSTFNWGCDVGICESTPFRNAQGRIVVRKPKVVSRRSRRLEAGEAERLMQHASPFLAGVIQAALETGMRLGELLSLQFDQVTFVDGEPIEIYLPGAKTKSKKPRTIPELSPRLREIIKLRKGELGPKDYVFGTASGRRLGSIKRQWEATKLRAMGVTPAYLRPGVFTKACREALHRQDLHFHDLRREAASVLLESGAPMTHVKDLLGHAALTTTDIYLGSRPKALKESMASRNARLFPHNSPNQPDPFPSNAPEPTPVRVDKTLH